MNAFLLPFGHRPPKSRGTWTPIRREASLLLATILDDMKTTMSDLLGSLESSLVADASKQAIAMLSQYLSRWRVDVSSTQERLVTSIAEHQREVKNWSEEISFKDLLKPKATSQVFVPLDIYLLPRRLRFSAQEELLCAPLSSIL